MIWYILIALFILLLTWILIAPVMMVINTERQQYMFSLPGVLTAYIIYRNDRIYIRGWIFFIPVSIDPMKMRRRKKRSEEKVERKKRKKRKSRPSFGRMISKASRAIRLRRFELDLDTDNFPLNAQLVPLFSLANSNQHINMSVNFEGRLFLHLDVRTRVVAILWMMLTK